MTFASHAKGPEFDPRPDVREMAASDGGVAVSPDLFYSSSPEPETERFIPTPIGYSFSNPALIFQMVCAYMYIREINDGNLPTESGAPCVIVDLNNEEAPSNCRLLNPNNQKY